MMMDLLATPNMPRHAVAKKGADADKPSENLIEQLSEEFDKYDWGVKKLRLVRSRQKKFLTSLAEKRAEQQALTGIIQFHNVDLSHTDLSNIDLTDVDLTGANLTNTNLSGARLVGANLTGAKLVRTILVNADLTDAILTDAVIDRITRFTLRQVANLQWYEVAQQSISGFNQAWGKLKSVDGFNAFETMLKRINELDLESPSAITESLEMLEVMVRSPDIARIVIQSSQRVGVNCMAHLLMTFNSAQCLAKFGSLCETNDVSSDGHQKALAYAKAIVEVNLLDEATLPVMRNQWAEGRRTCNGNGTGPNVSEALAVQLALRHQLATRLDLPSPLNVPVRITGAANLDRSDQEFVMAFIAERMNDRDQLLDALVTLPIWRAYLARVLNQPASDAALRLKTAEMLELSFSRKRESSV